MAEARIRDIPDTLWVKVLPAKERKIVPAGTTLIVNDPLGAGRGEIVLVVQGSSARMTDLTSKIPTDGLIIGIVDSISVESNTVYRKDK